MVVAGIDVSKALLDVSVADGPVHRFENSDPGLRRLLQHMARAGATQAVCEATGGYERLLVSRLRAAGIPVQVAHPLRVRAFARACGYEAKTDALDARVLARYGQVFPASDTGPSESEEEREELQQLLRRHRQLVDQRVQERNRLDKGIRPAVGRSTRRHLAWLDKEIARLDREYQALLQGSVALRAQATLYRSVPGVGSLTAAMLVAFLPELGQRDSKALTALVGLAPWSRDSGHKRGQRSIRGGRAAVRHALYMAALSVIRQEGIHQHFYQGLRQRGKTGKVALVAVMRKLLLHLNAVARRGTPWLPQEEWQSEPSRA
ncbi:MAG: IS110 family transposase [Caldilineaceae bacterium]|nr:IS110 family transposase [Caldilineaceae bacterium]